MLNSIEPAARPPTRLSFLWRDLGVAYLASGLVAFVFCATGPVAVILSVATMGGLSSAELSSWLFGAFALNGVLSIWMSWRYRQPLVLLWTIPGAVLVGPALMHAGFAEVIGAYLMIGLLTLVLGLSGWVRRVMAAFPMPIVMGMVAGVFLRFGIDLVRALHDDVVMVAPMGIVFLLLSAWPAAGRRLPPLIGALLTGAVTILLLGRFHGDGQAVDVLVHPILHWPQWSAAIQLELVVPIMISVLLVQNGQGIVVLRSSGHEPPINMITAACGGWTLLNAVFGAVPTCLTGPSNAIICASGQRDRHYVGAIALGVMAILFGLAAPWFSRLLLGTPPAYIAALAGLAMLRVLQSSFVGAFGAGRFTLGASITFIVTVSDVIVLNIGSAFWGLIAGYLVSWLLERSDFHWE